MPYRSMFQESSGANSMPDTIGAMIMTDAPCSRTGINGGIVNTLCSPKNTLSWTNLNTRNGSYPTYSAVVRLMDPGLRRTRGTTL